MKKALVMALMLAVGSVTACTSKEVEEKNAENANPTQVQEAQSDEQSEGRPEIRRKKQIDDLEVKAGYGDKFEIVTTIFPVYDWVREMTRGNNKVEITMLYDNGVDLHNYQPTADDIVKIGSCDIFFYVGGESDEWVEDVLKQATNPDLTAVNLMDYLNVYEEETPTGLPDEDEEEVEYDEHIWLSVRNAQDACKVIENVVSRKDPDGKDHYEYVAGFYQVRLDELDAEYRKAFKDGGTLIFGDRFPFLYLVKDYGLDYYAAFRGCSAESEASFETITFLASKVDELKADVIYKLEGSDISIAQTIRENTKNKDQTIMDVNSMQSITAEDLMSSDCNYINIMRNNMFILAESVGGYIE